MSPPARRIALIGNQAASLLNFRRELIAAWLARDAEVFALAPDWCDKTRAQLRQWGATPVDYALKRTGMNPVQDLAHTLRLARLLKKLRIDICFTYFIKPVIYGTLAARLAGVPQRFAMIEGAGYVFNDAASSLKHHILRKIVTSLYTLSLKHTQKTFFLNSEDQTLFIQTGMLSANQAVQLGPIGVDLNYFCPSPLPPGPPCFLMAARLIAAKGVKEFMEAAAEVHKHRPDARFILLGATDANPGALSETLIRTWTQNYRVDWPGAVSDVRPYLAQASVCVLPSYYKEGVPRSLQEAAACARPVITTDTPGCRDTIIPGKTGLLVPPKNSQALAHAMLKILENPNELAKMGQNARQLAQNRFNAHTTCARLCDEMGLPAPPTLDATKQAKP